MHRTIVGVIAVAIGAIACGSAGPQSTGESGPVFLGETIPTGMIGVTRVEVNPDGTRTVTHSAITAEEDELERDVRAAQRSSSSPETRRAYALTQDSACADADVWLYNYTVGSSPGCKQEICFVNNGSGPDFADLADYQIATYFYPTRGCTYITDAKWAGAVESYYPGDQDGCIGYSSSGNYPDGNYDYVNFGVDGSEANVPSGLVQYTDYVSLSKSTTSGDTSGFCHTSIP